MTKITKADVLAKRAECVAAKAALKAIAQDPNHCGNALHEAREAAKVAEWAYSEAYRIYSGL